MLSSRIVSARLNCVKITVRTCNGCPQGGVLPPLLYIMVMLITRKRKIILKCTNELLAKSAQNLAIFICSDSQSVLKAIDTYKFHSTLVLECRDYVQLLALKTPVTLAWVPGHSNIQGNEMADSLAKSGVEKSITSTEPYLKAPSSHFKNFINEWKSVTFKKRWESKDHANARQSKNCININAKNSKSLLLLSRRNIRRLTNILCSLNKHINTIGLSNSPLCASCGDIETAGHFLCKWVQPYPLKLTN